MRGAVAGPSGARIRWVELEGGGPPIVYLHGLGATSSAYFTGIAARPELGGRRSLLVDLLGFGMSDRPADFGYTLDEHAGSVARVLDSQGVSGADVVGHSMGGAVAIVLAERRPDLVRALVLVEPNLDPSTPDPASTGSRGMAACSEAEFLAHGFERTLDTAGETWRATMRLADPVALYRSAVGLVRGTSPTMREMLMAQPIPRTLVEGGLSDPSPGMDEVIASGVRWVVVPDAGHNVMIDNPGGFLDAVTPVLV